MKKIIGYDENGNPNCICDDGNVYTNCGNNCECCDYVSSAVDVSSSYVNFETLSCPCSFQVVKNKFGNLECELENYGVKNRVTPIKLSNHTLNGRMPNIGDKWDCIDSKTCGRGGIEWDTLHVVSVKESISNKFIARIDSKYSTSNCHVPKTTLNEFDNIIEDIYYDPNELNGIDINTIEDTIDDLPLFESKDQAFYWDLIKGSKTGETSEYLGGDGIIKYIPGYYYPIKKLITSCYINKDNILDVNINADWNYVSYASQNKKCEIPAAGGTLQIEIKGQNNPIVDISIKNSSKRSLLKRKIKNNIINGEYVLKLDIPPLSKGRTQEYYNIEIKPTADTSYYNRGQFISTGVLKYTIWQFNDPTFTFSTTASTIANSSSGTTTVGSITGLANSYSSKSTTHVATLSRSSGIDKYFLKSDSLLLNDVITRSDIIKKVIVNQEDKKDLECRSQITISDSGSSRTYTNGVNSSAIAVIEPGMTFIGEIIKTKTIYKRIDLDEHLKEPCDDVEALDILTNRFELENTTNLFSGMTVTGTSSDGKEFKSILHSVDCSKTITLKSHHMINMYGVLTFTWKDGGEVRSLTGNTLNLVGCVKLPKNTEISFSKSNEPHVNGTISIDKNGTSSIVVTATIDNCYMGQDDVTYSLDLDSIITNQTPARDQYIKLGKDETIYIDFAKGIDTYSIGNRTGLTIDIVSSPKNGKYSGRIYTPNAGFVGKDKIEFQLTHLSGGEISTASISEQKTIYITVE